ncbi:MAG: MFS transporter [Rhodoferax sp.]|uniref:MFS transporter n=1 Tax=Rhodoferax sp. TaxID=50421 RepID=UPI0026160F31|nr:MFS transporter [Rhodoferax sp.]MDD5332539.1 MFS transporter [Rhodoferax sp.]
MASLSGLFSLGFLTINCQFALVTAIAALFFAFSGYLQQLGIAPATAGFILSADALAALIVQLLISPLIHSGTVSRWLLGGSLLLSAALFMLAHVTSVALLTAARLLQGAGFMCVLASLITMVVRYIPPEMSGRAFGWLSLVRLIPYAAIPLVFDQLALAPASFAALLNIAAVVALVPVLALLLPSSWQTEGVEASQAPGWSGMRASLGCRSVLLLLLSALLFFCGYSAIFFFLQQFGQTLGVANASLFFTLATLVMILVRLGGGWLFDRYDKTLVGAAGLLLIALCYGLLPLCASSRMFFVLAGFAGLGWGIAMPLQAAAMFDISSPSTRAMNQNLLIVMMQGGFFIGPFVGGALISRFGYAALFACLAGTTLLAGVLMLGVKTPDSGGSAV